MTLAILKVFFQVVSSKVFLTGNTKRTFTFYVLRSKASRVFEFPQGTYWKAGFEMKKKKTNL